MMNHGKRKTIFVTAVDSFGPYLKIAGQFNPEGIRNVQAKIHNALPCCYPFANLPAYSKFIQPGLFCLCKRKINDKLDIFSLKNGTELWCRAQITSSIMWKYNTPQVAVDLIDYGLSMTVFSTDLLFSQNQDILQGIPPLSSHFIMLGIGSEWKKADLEEISRMVLYEKLIMSIEMEIENYKFIKLVWKDFNLAEYLIHQKKIGAPVSNELLRDNFMKLTSKQHSDMFAQSLSCGVMPPYSNNNKAFQSYSVNNNNLMFTERTVSDMSSFPIPYPMKQLSPMGNMGPMIQGVQYQKNVSTFIGHSINTYTTRFSRPVPPEPIRCSTKRGSATFKSNNLPVGTTHDVCISFVENGPCLFSVQLLSAQKELTYMMNKIETVPLKQFSDKPSLGTACIARYSEDGQLYRALITSVQPTSCKVAYIDYGNVEMVPYRDLFEIPDQFLDAKVFAIRFTLSGYKELEPIDENLKQVFKDMVIFKNCKLKVMPLEGPPLVQYCELYMNEKNMLETLKAIQKSRLAFPKAEVLQTGDIVEIRYIDSPKHFYVQKTSNIEEFEKLMDDMFIYYNKNQVVPTSLTTGAPCTVKYDNEWYRAEIVSFDLNSVVVRHVDFGYEQNVTKNLLSTISEYHLQLPRQAIQCCLKGFENNELSKDIATTQFEMLAEDSNRSRRSFTVKVFRIEPDGTNLVNLCTKDLNVMKKLYKLSMPFDRYLSLEKEDFNSSIENGELKNQGVKRNSEATSSNSPAISYDNNMTVKKTDPSNAYNANALNKSAGVNTSIEWDKNSSASSIDHDSHSNSSENKKKKYGTKALTSPGNGNEYFHGEKRPNRSSRNLPPRLQNLKNQENESRRQNKYRGEHISQSNSYSMKENEKPSQGNFLPAKGESNDNREDIFVEEYVPLDKEFPKIHIDLPAREEVDICWWISPHQFYTHLKSRKADFENLMRRIQAFYESKPIVQLTIKVNSHVIVRHNNKMYRARITACNQGLRKFKAYCVDFGNTYTVSDQDIWQVDKRFSEFPCMAYLCSLSGIVSNYDHLYILDQMEKYLIPDSVLQCEYIEREGDMYYVNVNVNGLSLRDTLKEQGLITEVCPELRLQLLANQQIRAKIVNVKSMLNFQIEMRINDLDVKLFSSYDDIRFVKSNPEIDERFGEFYEGKSSILNVTNVTENKVIMVKPVIPLFKDDIKSYICTYPIVLEAFTARVVYIHSYYRLYVQMVSNEDEISGLLNDMYAYYEEGGEEIQNLDLDCVCAANGSDENWYRARIASKISNDSFEVFYIDYGNTEIIALRSESGKLQIKKLEEQFYENKSALAIEINLPIKSICADEKKDNYSAVDSNNADEEEIKLANEISTLTSNYELTVKSIEVRKNRLIADLCLNDYSIVDVLKDKGLIQGSKDLAYIQKIIDEEPPNYLTYIETVDLTNEEEELKCSSSSKADVAAPIVESELSYNLDVPHRLDEHPAAEEFDRQEMSEPIATDVYANMERANLSHCDNPCRFFLHLESKIDQLYKLQENLQIVASSLPPLMRILKGANCISLYSVDHQWYRAKIMDSELMVVQFIDYGNTDALTETTDIKEMNVFSDIEPLCIPCTLALKPNSTSDWIDAANEIFNNSYNKTLHFEYIVRGEPGEKNFIRLFVDGIDVAEKLIADGFALPLETVSSGSKCFVSHINNLNDFYIQMEHDSGALELIESYLSNHEQLPLIQNFSQNLICAALFPDDGNWYRAKLLSCDNEGNEVLFIDYGNTAISPQIKEISEEIAKLPFLSKKCSLYLPDDIVCWSEAAEEKFAELSAFGETVFVVELKEPSDRAIVKLYADGCNVIDILTPLCNRMQKVDHNMNTSICNTTLQTSITECEQNKIQEAIISHYNSPQDFYIQFSSDVDRLEDMTTSLNEIGMDELKNPEVGMICAAKFPEDETFYRSRILEKGNKDGEYRVIFIDFGNDSLTNELRVLPEDLQCTQHFAKLCTLENIKNIEETKINEMFNTIFEKFNGIVKVEFIDRDSTPAVVNLFSIEDESLINKIESLTLTNTDTLHVDTVQNKDCFVSHAVSTNEFYVQMKSQTHRLDTIANELKLANTMTLVTMPEINALYAAYCREDVIYYRGMLSQILPNNEYEVLAVDFGYTFITNDLRELPTEVKNIPYVAKKCCLDEVPIAEASAIQEYFATLLESHFGEMFQIEEETFENGIFKVKLQISYQDVAEKLRCALEKGKNPIEESPLVPLHNCNIIHVNSPNSFYVQRSEDFPEIEKITDTLLDAEESFEPFENLSVGAICAAQFPEDDAFYRAKILSVNGQECEVLYLDFGNTSNSTKFRTLPEDLINIEPYGKHCALENLYDVDFHSNEANICFNELINSRFSETFQIEVLQASTDPIIVRLFYQQTNVASELVAAIRKMESKLDKCEEIKIDEENEG